VSAADRPSTAGEEGPAWSATAEIWDRHWARLADPARQVVLEQAAVGHGTRFLDMGCGTGELCAFAAERGATVAGIDAAEGMIERARARLPEADLRVGAIENLPWDDDSFDVVAGFNSFQFAAERLDGFREAGRVARRGGLVAVCVWGPREHNDLQRLFDVVRALDPAAEDEAQEDPAPAFGRHGVLEGLAGEAGLTVLATGEIDVPYETADATELVGALEFDLVHTGIADSVDRAAFEEAVEGAAAERRREDGSYRFHNTFRWLLAAA
jgi:SAM-dependent methyltransferase